jgi:hypothetical protein
LIDEAVGCRFNDDEIDERRRRGDGMSGMWF